MTMPDQDGLEMLTYEQAAAREGVPVSKVKEWVQTGRLTVVRYGHRTVRIARTDLDEFRAAHRTPGAGEAA